MTHRSDGQEVGKVMAYLETQVEKTGVASVKVSDGEVFMFSVDKLAEIVIAAANKGEKRITIFVKTGQLVADLQLN